MTAAPMMDIDTTEPDWAMAWQLMHWITPTRPPTEREVCLAAWLLLDQGVERRDIATRLRLTKYQVAMLADLRTAAARGTRKAAVAARLLAPSRYERGILGVPGVCRD